MLDGAQLAPVQRETLARVAALHLEGNAGFYAQLRAKLGALEFGGRAAYRPMDARSVKLPPVSRALFNGYGGFVEDGYAIDASEPTPVAWSNVLAGERSARLYLSLFLLPLWQEQPHGAPDAFLQRPVARGLGA